MFFLSLKLLEFLVSRISISPCCAAQNLGAGHVFWWARPPAPHVGADVAKQLQGLSLPCLRAFYVHGSRDLLAACELREIEYEQRMQQQTIEDKQGRIAYYRRMSKHQLDLTPEHTQYR